MRNDLTLQHVAPWPTRGGQPAEIPVSGVRSHNPAPRKQPTARLTEWVHLTVTLESRYEQLAWLGIAVAALGVLILSLSLQV